MERIFSVLSVHLYALERLALKFSLTLLHWMWLKKYSFLQFEDNKRCMLFGVVFPLVPKVFRGEIIIMILDILDNAYRYLTLNTGFARAFDFLLCPDLKKLPTDKYDIDDHVFALVTKDPGQKRQDALLETHEKYIDIGWNRHHGMEAQILVSTAFRAI